MSRRLSIYGLPGPRWYVRWRGLRWLRYGLCPCCYSSPPQQDCPVCAGDYEYGNHGPHGITDEKREAWRFRWELRCQAHKAGVL